MFDKILLFSGGLDSYIAWHFLGKPQCVYFDIGHRYAEKELEQIKALMEADESLNVIIDSSFDLSMWEEPDAYIPARNLLLAIGGARYSDNICLVVQKGETDLGDRSRVFFLETGETLSRVLKRNISLDTPFWNMTKVDMVKWFVDNEKPIDLLLKTTSCYIGEEVPCGNCPACIRRAIALELNGLKEEYKVNPKETELAQEYLKRAESGCYIPERNNDIKRWLELK